MVDEALLSKDLAGRSHVVTGGNSGIGLSTVKQLAKQGAEVFLCARNLDVATKLALEISNDCCKDNGGSVKPMQLDLASLESVREFAKKFTEENTKLDVLVNNAGVMNTPATAKTKDGFEMQFGVCHLGHFLLTLLLKDVLAKGTESRVVNVSSAFHVDAQGKIGHIAFEDLMFETRPYDGWTAYSQCKLANVLFAKELSKRWADAGITAVSLHPGFVKSNLINNTVPKAIQWLVNPYLSWSKGMVQPWQGVQSHLHCILAPTIENGAYYSQNGSPAGVTGGWPLASPNKEAHDEEVASKLWDVSEKLVGL